VRLFELSSLGKYLLGLCRGTAKSLTAAQSAQLAKEHLVIGPNDEPIYVIPDQLYEENQVLVERWTTTRPYPVLWEQKGKYGIARGKMVDVFTASGTGEHNLGSLLFYIRTNERSIKGAEMAKDEDYAYGINPFRVPLPDVHYTPEELKEMGFGGDDDD